MTFGSVVSACEQDRRYALAPCPGWWGSPAAQGSLKSGYPQLVNLGYNYNQLIARGCLSVGSWLTIYLNGDGYYPVMLLNNWLCGDSGDYGWRTFRPNKEGIVMITGCFMVNGS